jgi:hypothetical protein
MGESFLIQKLITTVGSGVNYVNFIAQDVDGVKYIVHNGYDYVTNNNPTDITFNSWYTQSSSLLTPVINNVITEPYVFVNGPNLAGVDYEKHIKLNNYVALNSTARYRIDKEFSDVLFATREHSFVDSDSRTVYTVGLVRRNLNTSLLGVTNPPNNVTFAGLDGAGVYNIARTSSGFIVSAVFSSGELVDYAMMRFGTTGTYSNGSFYNGAVSTFTELLPEGANYYTSQANRLVYKRFTNDANIAVSALNVGGGFNKIGNFVYTCNLTDITRFNRITLVGAVSNNLTGLNLSGVQFFSGRDIVGDNQYIYTLLRNNADSSNRSVVQLHTNLTFSNYLGINQIIDSIDVVNNHLYVYVNLPANTFKFNNQFYTKKIIKYTNSFVPVANFYVNNFSTSAGDLFSKNKSLYLQTGVNLYQFGYLEPTEQEVIEAFKITNVMEE